MKKNILENIKSQKSKELIFISFFAFLTILFLTTTIIFGSLYMNIPKKTTSPKRSLEELPKDSSEESRYIEVLSKVTEAEGAYCKQGKHDIKNSKYFKYIDIYNMKSSGSLVLLENFKTYQQTSEITCGIASLIMAVYYLNNRVLNETEMAIKAGTNETHGTLLANLQKLVIELGFDYESRTNFTEENDPTSDVEPFAAYIKESITSKEPIIVISNDWGGHYSVIIGYDDMGTEDYTEDDIIILADPYDTTDHMSDGYTIFSFERFYYQMVVEIFEIPGEKLYFNRIKRKVKN